MVISREAKAKTIPVGSGPKDIFFFLLKSFIPTFAIAYLIVLMIPISIGLVTLAMGEFDGLIAAFFIFFIMLFSMVILIPILVLPVSLSVLIVWNIVKQGNNTHLFNDRIVVQHQNWSMTPPMTNTIPLALISHTQKADEAYWKDRWKKTKTIWKIMKLHPLPPNGGLHPMYSPRKNLLILFLREPIKVNNMKLGTWTRLGLTVNEHWVREVIIDVEPEFQDLLIKEIKWRKSRVRPDYDFNS